MKRRTMMAMRHADNRSDLLEVQWVFLIIGTSMSFGTISHGVRSQLPQRLESTSCTRFSPRDIDALLRSFVSSKEYSLRMIERCWSLYCNGDVVALAADNSPTCAICRNYMLIHNSSPYNHEWWPVFEQLNCTVDAFLIADWAIKRNVLFDYITWEANWKLLDFTLRLDSLYSLMCLSILTVTKIGDCDLWRRARLQIKKKLNLGLSNELLHVVLASLCILSPSVQFCFRAIKQRRNLQLTIFRFRRWCMKQPGTGQRQNPKKKNKGEAFPGHGRNSSSREKTKKTTMLQDMGARARSCGWLTRVPIMSHPSASRQCLT